MDEVKFQQAAAKFGDIRERMKDSLGHLEDCNTNMLYLRQIRNACFTLFQKDPCEMYITQYLQASQAISLAQISQTLLEMKIQKGGK